MAGVLVGGVVALAIHPQWWEFLGDNYWWPISIFGVLLFQTATRKILDTYVTDGATIKEPFMWLFAYVALSAAYLVVHSCHDSCHVCVKVIATNCRIDNVQQPYMLFSTTHEK